VNAVVDTGSDSVVIDKKHESKSMVHEDPPKKEIIGYGSGDATMEIVKDTVQVGTSVQVGQKIKLMEGNTFGFSIEGILPLGPSGQSDWSLDSFSMCFQPNGEGSLMIGDGSGASIPATGQWEIPIKSITANGQSTGLTGQGVPDSGTTLMISPSTRELANLYVEICKAWDGCKNKNGEKGATVDDFYDSVEGDCGATVPELTFDFGQGSAVVPGKGYVILDSGKCVPAFDVDSSFSFWILGLPLFSSNKVHFSGNHVGFTAGGCSGCGGGLDQRRSEKEVWEISGPPRWPTRSQRSAMKPEFVLDGDLTNPNEALVSTDPNVVQLLTHLSERSWASSK
jgi:hypothetical protein